MSQATVLNLVQLLSNNQADTALQTSFYSDAVYDLARDNWLTTTAVLSYTEGVSTVTLPSDLINMLQVFFDNVCLSQMSIEDMLYLYGENWRQRKGYPTAYVIEAETTKTIEVSPIPTVTSPASTDVNAGYQPYSGAVIYSQTRTDVPTYLELPLALKILQREYQRESDHQDLAMAALCGALADMILAMLKARPALP